MFLLLSSDVSQVCIGIGQEVLVSPQCRQCALGMRMLTTEATHCDAACQDASHLQRAQQLSELRVHCPYVKDGLCRWLCIPRVCGFHHLACRMGWHAALESWGMNHAS